MGLIIGIFWFQKLFDSDWSCKVWKKNDWMIDKKMKTKRCWPCTVAHWNWLYCDVVWHNLHVVQDLSYALVLVLSTPRSGIICITR
jgi:hypothetical protein